LFSTGSNSKIYPQLSKMKLYSDDFGYNKQADAGIIKLIRRGRIFGASVLATMVSASSLRRLLYTLEQKNNFILGLHINLIEGYPTQHFLKISTLVDRDGRFFSLIFFLANLFLGRINKNQIKSEIEGQLSKLLKKGLIVKMLDSHQHTHAFSPVAEITVDIARKYNISYIRSFGSIKNYSFKAKLTYAVIRVLAFLSYLAVYRKFGLPATWRSKQEFDWTVMSWESNTFDIDSVNKNRSAFVIHPYLPYDTNRSYRSFIK